MMRRLKSEISVYEKEFPVPEKYQSTCSNRELKQKKSYWVVKLKDTDAPVVTYRFNIVLQPKDTNILASGIMYHGQLWKFDTDVGSTRCGLMTKIVYLGLTDEDITKNGGYDVKEDDYFTENEKRLTEATKKCMRVMWVWNKADPIEAGKVYLHAGVSTGYEMIFMFNEGLNPDGSVMKISKAVAEFVGHEQDFLDKYGDDWYYCKCKSSQQKECENMQ